MKLSVIDDLCLPSAICIVMESICVFRQVTQLVDIGLAQNFERGTNTLFANAAKRPKQSSRWKMLGISDTCKCFQDRSYRVSNLTRIAQAFS